MICQTNHISNRTKLSTREVATHSGACVVNLYSCAIHCSDHVHDTTASDVCVYSIRTCASDSDYCIEHKGINYKYTL